MNLLGDNRWWTLRSEMTTHINDVVPLCAPYHIRAEIVAFTSVPIAREFVTDLYHAVAGEIAPLESTA